MNSRKGLTDQKQPELPLLVDQCEMLDDEGRDTLPNRMRGTLQSAFDTLGFRETVAQLQGEIRALCTADNVLWIIGYSGGKDSTATPQLIATAIAALPPGNPRESGNVISTGNLLENPIVSAGFGNPLAIPLRRCPASVRGSAPQGPMAGTMVKADTQENPRSVHETQSHRS